MENHQKLKDANVFDKMKKYSQNGIKSRISTENNKCGQTGKIHQRIQMMEKRNSPNVISEQHSKKFSTTPEDSSMLLQTISSPPASPKSRSSSPSSFHSSSSPSSDTSDVDEPVANTLRLWESRNSTQLITSPNADILRRKDLNWTIDQMVSALLREWRMNDRDDEWMTKKREEVWSEWRKMEQVAVTEEEKRQAEDKKQELLDRCLKEESMRKKIISSEIKQAKRFYATYGIWVMKNWASSKTEIRMWERAARKLNRKNKKLQEKQLEENNEFLYRIEELVNLEKKDCAHNNDKNEVCSFQSQSSTLCHDSKNLPSLDSAVSAQDKAGSNVLQIQLNESESQHSFKYTSFSSSSSPTTMTSSSSSVHLTLPLHSPFSCTSSISSPSHSSSRLIESQRQIFAQPSMPSVVNMTKDSENADYHCNEAEDLQATKCFSKKDGKEHSSQEMICDSKNNFSVGPLFDHPPPRPVVECTLLKENTDFSFIAPFKSYRSVDIRSSATNCSHSTLCHAQNTFQEKNNPPPRKKHGKVSLVLPVHQKPLFAAPLPYPQLSITSHISAAQPITFTMPPIPKVDLPIVFPNFFEF
eukprot:MONOS_851.1-p1 / transcript=MONOS_851.1 / gene=MONOS_851 / organism=Monocercomonoides_exilis_PA203 / gene_product=unspecified product / transcript_product=unspecified product / location=Mono_scaffold00014:84081-85835(-) / protein_length=585 / sequence_SO=supercontig / SO=protein_coding / is_pseudo=false